MTTAYELDLDIKQELELTTLIIDELDLDIKQEPELTTPIIDEVDLVNICTVEQLNNVSEDFLSGDDKRPFFLEMWPGTSTSTTYVRWLTVPCLSFLSRASKDSRITEWSTLSNTFWKEIPASPILHLLTQSSFTILTSV